jgi:hypothetical protein
MVAVNRDLAEVRRLHELHPSAWVNAELYAFLGPRRVRLMARGWIEQKFERVANQNTPFVRLTDAGREAATAGRPA